MTRIGASMVKAVLLASSVLAAPVGAGVKIVIFPPVEFIATATPVYFEGHAAYRYGDRWYYREGRTWRGYEVEPRYLREYREHHEHEMDRRFYYGRGRDRGWDRDRDRDRDRH